jgi:hypothetical protein
MKSFITRPTVLLACALALAGCGGKAQYDIDGQIVDAQGYASKVVYDGLTLSNNGETLVVPAGASTFKFTKQMEYGAVYNVAVVKSPAHQNCGVSSAANASDTAGRLSDINVLIVCAIQTHSITVALNEVAEGLVLTNGSYQAITLDNTAKTATFTVPYGNSYGITVLTPPKNGKTCTVANGVGTMGDDNITNVTVTCA